MIGHQSIRFFIFDLGDQVDWTVGENHVWTSNSTDKVGCTGGSVDNVVIAVESLVLDFNLHITRVKRQYSLFGS